MARVQPFRAARYASLETAGRRLLPDAGRVTSAEERQSLASSDPLHVAKLYESPDPWAALRRWKQEGALASEEPALYVVEMQPASRLSRRPPVHFLLGAISTEEAGLVELEEVRQREATPPLAPVPVIAADDQRVLRDLLADVVSDSPPVWESEIDSERARLWRLGGGTLARRVRAVVDELPARPLGAVPESGSFLAAVVPLSESGLQFLPYHRGLRGLPTFSAERFLTLVSDYARIYELDPPLTSMAGIEAAQERLATLASGHHAVLLVLPGGQGRLLRFRQALELSQIPAAPKSPTLRSLDLALLNSLVLRTVLGIKDPEAPDHPNVFPETSVEELVRKVLVGTFQVGFALNPPPAWEVRAIMEAHQSMPPKTLRLSPLPPAGLLFLDPEARG
ncbi:MAG: DUF1015 family protein [Myxococcaceae bacterium]